MLDKNEVVDTDPSEDKIVVTRKLVINGIYKHFKGDFYLVQDVAIHSETKEEYVVYRALYGDSNLYIRPKTMFLSKVDHEKYPDVKQHFRFELQKIESIKERDERYKKETEELEQQMKIDYEESINDKKEN